MEAETPIPDEELELRREALWPQWRRGLVVGIAGLLIAYIATGTRGALVWMFAALSAYWLVLAVLMLASARWRRRGPDRLRFASDCLHIPARFRRSRTISIPYAHIRAANETGRGWFAAFAIDSGVQVHSIAMSRLGEDGVARLLALLRDRIEAQPGGAARWAQIAALRARANQLRGRIAWATRSLGAIIAAVYLLQLAWSRITPWPDDGFGPIDMGGNAHALVAQGQVWRLATGNLLHANAQHILNNLLFLLALGTLLERLAGARFLLIVVLSTGLAAGAASAVLSPHLGPYLYSVGISGALFGIVGALAALTLRHWRDMPAGFRLPRQSWVGLLGLNLMAALAASHIDSAAHGGGLLAGLILGWFISAGSSSEAGPARLRMTGVVARAALAGLLAVWIGSVAAQAAHAFSETSRLADRVTMLRDEMARKRAGLLVQSQLAYAVALSPAARGAELRDARRVAESVLAAADSLKNARYLNTLASDVVAVLDDRLGDEDSAVRREVTLSARTYPPVVPHLARMLERRLAASGPVLIGDGVAKPTLQLVAGTLRFNAPQPVPRGGRVIALLHRNGKSLGLVSLYVPAGYSGEQILPLPVRYGGPSVRPPDATWLDGGSTLDVALFDSTGCGCRWPSMAPEWHELPHGAALLP